MLLITVPHAKREASGNHDEGAIQLIPFLRKSLDDRSVPYSFLVGDDVFRGVLDLNRGESRNTEYAKEFAKLLSLSDLHIDLHSFEYVDEDTSDEESYTVMGDDLREWSRSDIVFLTIPKITDEWFAHTVMEHLERLVTIDDIETDTYNFLTVFSQVAMDVPSILLEVNEGSRPSFPAVAEAVAEAVAVHLGLVEPPDAE